MCLINFIIHASYAPLLLPNFKRTFPGLLCSGNKPEVTVTDKLGFNSWTLASLNPDPGGARRDRTADLLRARQALSQLSYGPLTCLFSAMLCCVPLRSAMCTRAHSLPHCHAPRLAKKILRQHPENMGHFVLIEAWKCVVCCCT